LPSRRARGTSPRSPRTRPTRPAWTDNWFYSPTEGLDDDARLNNRLTREFGLRPVCGGGPEDPGPTEADRRDFELWLSQVDQPYPPEDQVESRRAWYRRNSIEAFNSLRQDESEVRA